MALVYITGISGSGKSEVRKELKARGYVAYGTDEDEIADYYNKETGARLSAEGRKAADYKTVAWRRIYEWKMPPERVAELAAQAKESVTFLCGVAANENEVWDLFDRVFALVVDDATMQHRIESRVNNDYGKLPHEMEVIWEWQKSTAEAYRKFGHITVDATRPVAIVVDEILDNLKSAGISGLARPS